MSRIEASKLVSLRKVLMYIDHFKERERICRTSFSTIDPSQKRKKMCDENKEQFFYRIDHFRVKYLLDKLILACYQQKRVPRFQRDIDRMAFMCLVLVNKLDNDMSRINFKVILNDFPDLFDNLEDLSNMEFQIFRDLEFKLLYDNNNNANKEAFGISGGVEKFTISEAKFFIDRKIDDFIKESDEKFHKETIKNLQQIKDTYGQIEMNLESERKSKKQKTC